MAESVPVPMYLKHWHWGGADAVIIARPFVTAVYGGGREGVEAYIQKIGSELADTMAMCGVSSLAEITRDCVSV